MPWKYREVQILDDASIGDSGTKTVDIKLEDPITSLIIRFKATHAGVLDDTPAQKNITHIELIDGGQVYYSLSGPQAVAATTYGLGRYPSCWIDGRAAMTDSMSFQLLFGRFLGDELLAFTAAKLRNPQLRVSWTDVDGFTDDSLTLGVTARIMEGLPPPSHALMWEEIEAWNTAAQGVHTVDLPVDLPIRALMHRVYHATEYWGGFHTHFKLDCDMGKYIPFDLDRGEYEDIVRAVMGPFHVAQHGTWNNAQWVQGWLGSIIGAHLTSIDSYTIANPYTAGAWNWVITYLRSNAGAEMEDRPCELVCTGYYPENCVLYPFGRLDDPATWFPATNYKLIQLKITEGQADGAASVCVQQKRSIP